uniref:Uncharacterized protein n=1 Tax=Denticeps clupeoides TaxID=299321 RepID=A0AAY4AH63_9TELE
KLILPTLGHPLHQETSSEVSWDSSHQNANHANDKSELFKDYNGMWKSHLENTDLYAEDSQHPMAKETRQRDKLNLVTERLRARLRQELQELRDRLWPYPTFPQQDLAKVKQLLGPLIDQLQGSLAAHTQEHCDKLGLHAQELESVSGSNTQEDACSQRVMAWIGQSQIDSNKKIAAYIHNFKSQTSSTTEELTDTVQKHLLQTVVARLGREADAWMLEVQGRMGLLRLSLAELRLSSLPLRDSVSSRLGEFCQTSVAQNQQLIATLEQQLSQLREQGSGDMSIIPPLNRLDTLRGDFTSQLRDLLRDIMHSII